MANRFWVGGSASWDATIGTKWATTSGGAGGAAVPTNTDDVFFDANSTGTCTLGVSGVCLSINFTGHTSTFNFNGFNLTIGGSTAGASNVAALFVATDTLTVGVSTLSFVSTSATQQTITTGGKSLSSLTFGGVGSSYILADALTATGVITVNNGIFNSGNFAISAVTFNMGTAATRTITLGSSAISLSATGIAWNAGGVTGLTFTANTAVVTLTGNLINANNIILVGGNLNGLSFVLNGGGVATVNTGGGATIGSLTFTGTNNKNNTYTFTGTLTITGTFTVTGQSAINRPLVSSNAPGTSRTITCSNAPSLSNVDFMDITAAGAGGTWSGTSIGDCLGNSNITFTAQAGGTSNGGNGVKLYWIGNLGDGSVGTNWSFSSGGSSAATIPLPQDDIYFDVNSFNGATQRVQLNMPRTARNMDTTGTTQTGCTVGTASGLNIGFFGSVTYAGTAVDDGNGSGQCTYYGRGTHTITNNNSLRYSSQLIQAPGGTYTLQDNFQTTNSNNKGIGFNNGTFDANNKNLAWQTYSIAATMTSVKMGSGTWQIVLAAGGQSWTMSAAASVLQSQTSTINYSNATSAARTFVGGGATYYILNLQNNGSTGAYTITGSNYFDTITFRDTTNARTLTFTITTLTTVRNFDVVGTSGKLMSVISSTGGTPAYLSIVGAPSTNDWLSVQDIFASEPYKFYVGSNTTSVSGNTNLNTGTAASAPYIRFSNYINTSGASPTVTAPFSLSANTGDLVVLQFFWATTPGTVTPPSGFTQTQAINSGTGGAFGQVFYKIAVGGETSWATSTTNAPGIVGLRVMLFTGWTGTPTLDVTDNNNSTAASVTTLSTGAGVSNTTSLGIAVATWVTNGLTSATSFSNSFEESRVLAQSPNTLSAVLPLTSTASRTSTAVWTSAHIASSQLAVFKDATGGVTPITFITYKPAWRS